MHHFFEMSETEKLDFSVGDAVQCRYDGGDDWYDAEITKCHPDGTYDVLYTDDDDTESFVPLHFIRPD